HFPQNNHETENMKFFSACLFVLLFVSSSFGQASSDAALRRAMRLDNDQRDASGKLPTLTAEEHLARAEAYSANRMFPQAREHWQKVFDNYPEHEGTAKALFGTARSYMWEKQYDKAVFWFEKLSPGYIDTKEGREGLAFKGASLVRLGKNIEAAKVYEQYTAMFPQGERVESSHLNIIDAYREAGKYDEANRWVDRTVSKFAGKPSEVNALHARLRFEIYRENWASAISTADRLLSRGSFAGAMAGSDEIKWLRALALEKSGKKADANAAFSSLAASNSYFGGLAADRNGGDKDLSGSASEYPVMFRTELLASARKNKIDPRFVLAIMKQESSFRANAKSPAGARGLLQLVFDTAVKYNKQAGYPNLHPDDLYSPATNIAIGSAYIGDLKGQFSGLYEAIAASYNGGEDNAARWLARSKPKEAGIFTAEVGFAESKAYVFKVMNNYRVYRTLYTEDLQRR
ncbi:MAG TPA: transglycosylase SLT domain-containing protein, partial [Pyrinomonadaceae bacterium]|nr:transglycosylase SLT domain-containing protein [Pyrinomonadaceae bacterium]